MDDLSPKWFITFIGDRMGKYALINAQDYGDARREAFNRFGTHWGFMYGIEDLGPQIEAYGIKELTGEDTP